MAPSSAGYLPGDMLDLSGQGKKTQAGNAINQGFNSALGYLAFGMPQAQRQLQEGYNTAKTAAEEGFGKATDTTKSGMSQARTDLSQGMNTAIGTARSGYEGAKEAYNTPGMVSTRGEIYQRIIGNGGLSPEVLAQQEAKAREEYGTGMRGAMQALNTYQGESGAAGLAGENLARAASSLAEKRANSVRDINIANEQLKRQEMTGAMGMAMQDAATQAGLSVQETNAVVGLQEKLATGMSNLTADETKTLANIAAQEGTTMSDLAMKLATGQAQLTADEIKALAEVAMGRGTAGATLATTKTGLFGLW